MITNIYELSRALKERSIKIILISNLYDWLLRSNWNCELSDDLKKYIENGGIVERMVGNND